MALSITSTIVGMIVSIIAVIVSVLSLKQTQHSIEAANRPYVVVYRDYIQILNNVQEYIIIKNFGKTGAIIDSLNCNPSYKNTVTNKNVFENIGDTFIAPGQSISTVTSINALKEERRGVTEININYHANKKHYQETINLNGELKSDLIFSKTNPSKNKGVEEIIIKATQETLRKKL